VHKNFDKNLSFGGGGGAKTWYCPKFKLATTISLCQGSVWFLKLITHTEANLNSKYDNAFYILWRNMWSTVIIFKGRHKQQGKNLEEQHCRSIPLKCVRSERGWGVGTKSVLQDSGCSTSVGCNEKHGAAYKAVVTIVAVSVRGTSSVTSRG